MLCNTFVEGWMACCVQVMKMYGYQELMVLLTITQVDSMKFGGDCKLQLFHFSTSTGAGMHSLLTSTIPVMGCIIVYRMNQHHTPTPDQYGTVTLNSHV